MLIFHSYVRNHQKVPKLTIKNVDLTDENG
jgi:hypothetical protein